MEGRGHQKAFPLRQPLDAVDPPATMIAFRVLLNGKEICVAGIGEEGVLNAGVHWLRVPRGTSPAAKQYTGLQIFGGLYTPTKEHRSWDAPDLEVGDTVTIEIVETEAITPHDSTEVDEDDDED